jgi:hypothetical protein
MFKNHVSGTRKGELESFQDIPFLFGYLCIEGIPDFSLYLPDRPKDHQDIRYLNGTLKLPSNV